MAFSASEYQQAYEKFYQLAQDTKDIRLVKKAVRSALSSKNDELYLKQFFSFFETFIAYKKKLLLFIVLFCLVGIAAYQFKPVKQNVIAIVTKPNYLDNSGLTIKSRVKVPEGFTREHYSEGSFQEYIRNYTLKEAGAKVSFGVENLKVHSKLLQIHRIGSKTENL